MYWVFGLFLPFGSCEYTVMNNDTWYVFDSLPSVLLCIHLRVELLDHVGILCLTFWGAATVFSMTAAPFYVPTSSEQGFPFLHTNSYFFITGILYMGTKWYLIVGLIYIFLMTNDVAIFLCACWLFVYLLKKNVCPSPLAILELFCLVWVFLFLFLVWSCRSSLDYMVRILVLYQIYNLQSLLFSL